ncbi:MMPL family transporter [Conexibacter sp. W3-3-2]|uniref:MMPL family transporter n=1 Tax=Conexibacter sp. W3-3-2 TaxID=2675227 RepID=UPI0012B99926|nr:MMPL family transporter [Conexibacter sp. W3-3-2]MTD46529.1 MMPL family transporter [Conexibacter sp. W3-3-2]
MQAFMLRLDAAVHRHRRAVLALWAIALVAAVPFALRQSENLTGGGFAVPGSQSRAVEEALARDLPQAGHATLAAVLAPQPGATRAQGRAALDRVDRAAATVADVSLAPAARAAALRRIDAAPGRPLLVPLAATVDDLESSDVAADLRDELGLADERAGEPVRVGLVGQGALWAGLQDVSKEGLEKAEATGFPIVLLILLVVFGSLAAATLPLALGVFSVLITGGLIYGISLQLQMSVFVTNMASMIGIGVAVDYSLFVLARYREEVRGGATPEAARATAMATSGIAVLFSGLTVIVSLAGLYMVDTTAIRSMALGAILVVAVSMLASATLLPALIGALGRRAYARGRLFTAAPLVLRSWRRRAPGSTHPDAPAPVPFWERWTARVTRRPVLSLVAATGVLLALAVPALSLQTGNGALRQFPDGDPTRAAFEVAASLSSPGASAPVRVLTRFEQGTARDPQNAALVRRAAATLREDPRVAAVADPLSTRDGRGVLLVATPRADGESETTKGLVEDLRRELPAVARTADVQVGGTTAALVDFRDEVSSSMWKVVLFVLGLSYLVLMVLLRSVLLPLKAVIANLLSVGAAYGVLVAVFQWGWVDGFLGFQSPGYIDTITPPLILAVVFGLSMDYEVFLLSRIRERFDATGDTRRAVAEGIATSARTITSAALIMVAVFLVFVGTGVPSITQLGLGNAVAIAVDATLVRLVLVPAVMELLGRWSWWLPRPLDRLLPAVDMEQLHVPAEAQTPLGARRVGEEDREPAGVA